MSDFKIEKGILPVPTQTPINISTSQITKRAPGRPRVDHGFPCSGPCEHYLDCWLAKGLALPDWITIHDTPIIPEESLDKDPE